MPWLFCQVWGDSDAEPFPVKVDGGDTVGVLKKLIRAENPNDFEHIDPVHLKLWKWNQPGSVEGLDLGSSNALNPMETIEEIFENDPPQRKCVHIVIQVPAHDLPHKRQCFERTGRPLEYSTVEEFCDLAIKPFPNIHCPTADQVDILLRTPLQVQLPFALEIADEILVAHPYIIPRHPEASTSLKRISYLLAGIVGEKPVFAGAFTEDSYHQVWDSLIWATLAFFAEQLPSLDLECNRNSTDKYNSATTITGTRPDFLCWVRGALAFRGEEKAALISEAHKDLKIKFGQWNAVFYGQLPFVFAYVTGGCRIQFCLLMPNGQSQRLTNCIFDAKLPSHRLAIFRTIVNILRCLRSFEPLFPTEKVQLYDEMKRPNGVKVIIYPSYVVKKIPFVDFTDALADLYTLVKSNLPANLINLVSGPEYKGSDVVLKLSPVGFIPRPKEITELKAIIRDVLHGLQWLHSHGYVHRDVRWVNIIKECNGRARLIDLEYAGLEGRPNLEVALNHWPNLVRGQYRKETDIYSVGKLIMEYTSLFIQEDERNSMYNYVRKLQNGISVEMALGDPWIT